MVVERCIINRLAVSDHNCARSSVSACREWPEAAKLPCIETKLHPNEPFPSFSIISCVIECEIYRSYNCRKNIFYILEKKFIIYIISTSIVLLFFFIKLNENYKMIYLN